MSHWTPELEPPGESGPTWGGSARLGNPQLAAAAAVAFISVASVLFYVDWSVPEPTPGRQGEIQVGEAYPATVVLPGPELLELVRVEGGPFLMGRDQRRDSGGLDELWNGAQGVMMLEEFYIGKYEVTVAQYRACMEANGCAPSRPDLVGSIPDAPVVYVSWLEALQYCDWLERTVRSSTAGTEVLGGLPGDGWRVSLPSEAEWEKAARGADGRTYPWGEGIDSGRAKFMSPDGPTTVGSFPRGVSPYGALDMSGNVWEWTRSLYMPYPYNPSDRESLTAVGSRVLRGGSFRSNEGSVRAAYREYYEQEYRDDTLGFRVVVSRF